MRSCIRHRIIQKIENDCRKGAIQRFIQGHESSAGAANALMARGKQETGQRIKNYKAPPYPTLRQRGQAAEAAAKKLQYSAQTVKIVTPES